MQWPRNLLTDSGGFQMVSLLALAKIEEEGVTFQSPIDGTPMLLTPEESIGHQNRIGADIIMQLDDVVSSVMEDDARFEEAMYRYVPPTHPSTHPCLLHSLPVHPPTHPPIHTRSVRWLDRCLQAHARPTQQNLFGIIQGGLDTSPGGLRERCLKEMSKSTHPPTHSPTQPTKPLWDYSRRIRYLPRGPARTLSERNE